MSSDPGAAVGFGAAGRSLSLWASPLISAMQMLPWTGAGSGGSEMIEESMHTSCRAIYMEFHLFIFHGDRNSTFLVERP